MTTSTTIVVYRDRRLLAYAAAARIALHLADVQAKRGDASIVLTGGGMGIATLRALKDCELRDSVEWSSVDVWWGDERFLPSGDAERNETGAQEALLRYLPLDPARVHPMPAVGTNTLDQAAQEYSDQLTRTAKAGTLPRFDIVLLGMGPDGHVASLFPGHAAARSKDSVVAVHDSPKPPPERVSLTMSTIQSAEEVWLIVAGQEKADVVREALVDAESRLPASLARGTRATRWFLDRDAASKLPYH